MAWTPTRVRETLKARGLAPLHRLGQHFLVDPGRLDRIADAAGAAQFDCLEVGAGLGCLTEALAVRGHRVVALEIDRGFCAYLREAFQADPVTVVEGDALEVDLEAHVDPAKSVLCGNLPYYVTSPLLHRVLALPFVAYVVLIQREVADRLCAPPHDPGRGTLSVLVEAVGPARRLFDVPASAFYPQPDVSSAVIRIDRRPGSLAREGFEALEDTVGRVFRYRRKSIRQGLREGFGWPREEIESLLARTGLDGRARPADLSLGDWMCLTQGAQETGLRRDSK